MLGSKKINHSSFLIFEIHGGVVTLDWCMARKFKVKAKNSCPEVGEAISYVLEALTPE